jgi:hypothetical protein
MYVSSNEYRTANAQAGREKKRERHRLVREPGVAASFRRRVVGGESMPPVRAPWKHPTAATHVDGLVEVTDGREQFLPAHAQHGSLFFLDLR